MGARGPAPTPAKILELRGSNRAGRRGEEPKPDPRPPAPPKWMPAQAREVFRDVVLQLQFMGILGRCDVHVLARYAAALVRWRAMEEFLLENGQVYVRRGRGGRDAKGN